jgi:membrane protein implicated in regulation of membrane protease activity
VASRKTATGFFFMCACGCFVLAAVIAALVYTVIHGLWPAAIAVLLFAGLVGWLGRKMFVSRPPRKPGL